MCNCQDTLIPQIGVVTDICTETADVKTFRVEKIGGGKLFKHMPGQCAVLSVPGKGEAIFSITSSPTNEKYMEFSIKRCGSITNFLHFDIEPGQQIAVRGPYGNHFPVEDKLKGKDLLFIVSGIGLAPLLVSSIICWISVRITAALMLFTAHAARKILCVTMS